MRDIWPGLMVELVMRQQVDVNRKLRKSASGGGGGGGGLKKAGGCHSGLTGRSTRHKTYHADHHQTDLRERYQPGEVSEENTRTDGEPELQLGRDRGQPLRWRSSGWPGRGSGQFRRLLRRFSPR